MALRSFPKLPPQAPIGFSSMKMTQKLRATAHHKAGHFIATYILSPGTYQYMDSIIPGSGNLVAVSAEGLSLNIPNDDITVSYSVKGVRADKWLNSSSTRNIANT